MKNKNTVLKTLAIVFMALTVQSAIYVASINNITETIILAILSLLFGILSLVKKQGKIINIIVICISTLNLIVALITNSNYANDYNYEYETYKMGEAFVLNNGLQYEVTDFKRIPKENDDEKEYGIVSILVTNYTNHDARYNAYEFFMQNENMDYTERVYDDEIDGIKITESKTIIPGNAIVATMVFEISKKDEKFTLTEFENIDETRTRFIFIEVQ